MGFSDKSQALLDRKFRDSSNTLAIWRTIVGGAGQDFAVFADGWKEIVGNMSKARRAHGMDSSPAKNGILRAFRVEYRLIDYKGGMALLKTAEACSGSPQLARKLLV